MELTRQDFDVLIEAMESWEQKDFGKSILGAVFGGMGMRDASPEMKAKYERDMKEERAKDDAATKIRKERSVVIRSKLISIRDSITADKVFEDAAR